MRFFTGPKRPPVERLLWSRDIRFVHRLAAVAPGSRVLELDSGAVLIGPATDLTDFAANRIAREARGPDYGMVTVDPELPEADRYLMALSAAVQASGLADRIGMAQTTHVVQTKMLDYFFSLRRLHGVVFQPIVDLEHDALHEYECLFRPDMPMLPQSISSIVQAAIDTDRSIELDLFLVSSILEQCGRLEAERRAAGEPRRRYAVNVTPASLLDSRFEATAMAARVIEAGLEPRQITLECTEQQAVSDVVPLKRAVKALRRIGFGFAVDDAGAGYASFALIAALRPTVIKIDRDIVSGIARDDAKQALVEAFVSFGRRIGARLLAEGIEKRSDLVKIRELGVDFGQGYLLGRPTPEPGAPRPIESLLVDGTGRTRAALGGHVRRAASATATTPATRRLRTLPSD
ncbi:MAG TPA: EAL domain-containing protein [Candidatus Limnocylindrales bacterium]